MDATGIKLDAFAFIYPSDQHEGIWRAMKGFQAAAQEKKRRLCMLSSGTDYQKELALVGQLAEFDVLGAALYPLLPSFGDLVRFLQMLKDSRFPVVLVGAELPGQEISGVAIDGFHAGYTMTRHLLNGGRRRIGFLASRSWSVSVRDRYQGYKWALSEAGLPLEDKLVFLNPSMHVDFEDPLREPIEMARAYLDQVRDAGLQGVVCYSDFFARGLIRVAAERGLKVPEDLKVTGIDDYAIPIPDEVALTTYRVPYEEMGRIAFELLESRIVNPKGPALEKYVREKSS
ncbi:MAG: substrate-binding domain-containing protein [Verrucomicrobiota bacterium]